jgi:hypothetical protein
MKLSKLASAMPFAHYLGLSGSAAAAAEEDEDRKQKDGESDDDYAKRMEEMDKEEEKARKAEEEEKERARKAAEEEKEREAKRAKKAKGEDDDDDADMEEKDDADDEEEGKRAGRAKGARQRERIRCAKILAAGIEAGRVNQACVFAFDSGLTASAAIAALGAADLDAPKPAATRSSRLSERMSAVQTPNPGANSSAAPSADPAKALADRIVAVAERVRGK